MYGANATSSMAGLLKSCNIPPRYTSEINGGRRRRPSKQPEKVTAVCDTTTLNVRTIVFIINVM